MWLNDRLKLLTVHSVSFFDLVGKPNGKQTLGKGDLTKPVFFPLSLIFIDLQNSALRKVFFCTVLIFV